MDKYFLGYCVQCGCPFDLNVRIPQCLPCGHSVCTFCTGHSAVPSHYIQCGFCAGPILDTMHTLPLNWTIIQMLKKAEDDKKAMENYAQTPKAILCPEREICYMPSHSGIFPGYYVGIERIQPENPASTNSFMDSDTSEQTQKRSETELIEGMQRLKVSENDHPGNGYSMVQRENGNTMVLDDA